MLYTVKYKKPGWLFWRKLKRVKGDGIVMETGNSRFFILDDETRIELPTKFIFKFDRERFFVIKQDMEEEARQRVKAAE